MSILDHASVNISDYARAKAFYDRVLATLGITPMMAFEGQAVGYGKGHKPDFWLGVTKNSVSSTHIAFVASSRAEVDAFHKEGLAAGGKDNGGPGIRKEYHPGYYGAFLLDPDGNNIEAVIHER